MYSINFEQLKYETGYGFEDFLKDQEVKELSGHCNRCNYYSSIVDWNSGDEWCHNPTCDDYDLEEYAVIPDGKKYIYRKDQEFVTASDIVEDYFESMS